MTSSQTLSSAPHRFSQKALDLITHDSLREICASPGPFVTIFLPARLPGSADLPSAQGLKTILRDTAKELEHRRFQGPIDQLLKPLEDLAANPSILAGGHDSVVFASPGLFRHYRLHGPACKRLVVACHPHITPVLATLMPVQEFYVLAVAKKHLRLGRWRNGQGAEVLLPPRIPKSFEETLVFDQPDHDLQNRSGGRSSAQLGPARFGTSSERDMEHDRLHHYFRIVDRELTSMLKRAPLVLVGIGQVLAAYRSVAKYPRLITAKPTSPAHLAWDELIKNGQDAVLAARHAEAQEALREFQEETCGGRIVSGVRQVLAVARKGHVKRLILENDTVREGMLGPAGPMDPRPIEGAQDLINAAAVETIRANGEVYILDRGEMGGLGPIAGALRFSA